ncbi:hypothetical protein [Pyxidicoccus trucidator]|uniref:hypothetical protein n=1 Tax=Pyxidicoccus trucidator TaxID=2709662 RepID=UPI0013DCC914|nr:hypothetical protein [Pyxidicoccus trucidator]
MSTAADKTSEQLSQWTTGLNLAVSWSGLKALGLPAAALESFPTEFREGMVARADILCGWYGERDPLMMHGAGKLTLPRAPLRRCVEGI